MRSLNMLMIKYTRLDFVWCLCSWFKYFNQLTNIRELDDRLFGEESIWETALLSPILPQGVGSPSVFGQDLWWGRPSLESGRPGSHSQDL